MTAIDFHHPFLFSQNEDLWKEGWVRHRCRAWILQTDPALPVLPLVDREDQAAGFALGWPIDATGSWPAAPLRIPFHLGADPFDRVEEWIYSFGGRFLFILLGPAAGRIYPDAGATLGLVYAPDRGMAASTVSVLALHDRDHPVWSAPAGVFPDDRPDQFYPAGLTLDPALHRLLPNHYLDLASWRSVRHTPREAWTGLPADQVRPGVERIIAIVRRHIQTALQAAPRVYLPLTAGRDSRMLLACSREIHDRIEYVTFDYTALERTHSARADLEISRRLAERFRLRHHVLPVHASPSRETELLYLRRIGFAGGAGKSRDFDHACREHLDLSAAWLTGFASEVGRAAYWVATDRLQRPLTAEDLLRRMGLPVRAPFVQAVRTWLETLPPGLSVFTILDLAYWEHRVGCWASPHLYGAAPFSLSFFPLCHREIYELMLRLPLGNWRRYRLPRELIATAWPELLRLPFNALPGVRKMYSLARETGILSGRILSSIGLRLKSAQPSSCSRRNIRDSV